jgi:hypothetical protein
MLHGNISKGRALFRYEVKCNASCIPEVLSNHVTECLRMRTYCAVGCVWEVSAFAWHHNRTVNLEDSLSGWAASPDGKCEGTAPCWSPWKHSVTGFLNVETCCIHYTILYGQVLELLSRVLVIINGVCIGWPDSLHVIHSHSSGLQVI